MSVQVVNEKASQNGRGRWSIPVSIIKDKLLLKYIKEKGAEAQDRVNQIQNNRSEENNPQTIFLQFKKDLIEMAQKREKAIIPKLILETRKCEKELENVNNNSTLTTEEKIKESALLTQKLTDLKRKQHLEIRNNIYMKNRIEAETMTRSWTQSNKVEKPRDIIQYMLSENLNQTLMNKTHMKKTHKK